MIGLFISFFFIRGGYVKCTTNPSGGRPSDPEDVEHGDLVALGAFGELHHAATGLAAGAAGGASVDVGLRPPMPSLGRAAWTTA